jgi:ankyrin repeat protein
VLGRHELIDQLIEAGADPSAVHATRSAALVAIEREDVVSLRKLLAAGADPNAHKRGVSLIQAAAGLGFAGGVHALLEAGATREARSDFEEQMWRRAASRGHDVVLLRLVGNGSHLHLLATEERDAVIAAVERGDEAALAGLLSDADRRWEELRHEIADGDLNETQRLIALGSGIMRGHGEGELVAAIEDGQPHIVEWLLAIGADPVAPAHPDSATWLERDAPGGAHWTVDDGRSVFGRVPYQYVAQTTPAHLAFNVGPLDVVDLVLDRVEPNDLNLTDPDRSYLDDALRGFYRGHRDQRILERARVLGGAPTYTGPEADRFLSDICRWTRDAAAAVIGDYLEMGYRPRSAEDANYEQSFIGDDAALNNCIAASGKAAIALLERGADPNQPNSIGEPPVWEALTGLNNADATPALLARLLADGADANTLEWMPGRPLSYALARSQELEPGRAAPFEEAVQLLVSHGAKTSEELFAADEAPSPPEPLDLLPIR